MLPLCIVLDLDDTLFLERDYIFSGFAAVGRWAQAHFGIKDFALRATRHFEDGRRGSIFNDVLAECGCSAEDDDIAAMLSVYRRHFPSISLLPDAAEFLHRFRGIVRLGLVTDGPIESQRRKLAALQLHSVFDIVVLTAMWGQSYAKPSLRPFQLIQNRFGKDRMQFAYVADNPIKDFQGPRELNWKTIRVRRAAGIYSGAEATHSANADIEVQTLNEAISLFRLRSWSASARPIGKVCR